MKKHYYTVTTGCLLYCLTFLSYAQHEEHIHNMASSHHDHGQHHRNFLTPLFTKGAHLHAKGEWMLSYKFMSMQMGGMRQGTQRLSSQDVFAQGYRVAPTEMSMNMHMFGAMLGLSDELTIMAMLPYKYMSMKHLRLDRTEFTQNTQGFGDLELHSLFRLAGDESNEWIGGVGFSLPTGSVEETGNYPGTENTMLLYPMQPGSGTFDLKPRISYQHSFDNEWRLGAQVEGTVRLGTSKRDYRLGDRLGASVWTSTPLGRSWDLGGRLHYEVWGNATATGANGMMTMMNGSFMVPVADPKLSGGNRLDATLSLDYSPQGFAEGHRFGLEFTLPVAQNLNGPQMETDYSFGVGWQFSF